ncbi:MAG: hypothetical protein AB7Q01_04020 [Gammaproteobacteria bacterium]
MLAIVQRVFDVHVARKSGRREHYDGASKARKAGLQIRTAEAWAEIECAKALATAIGAKFERLACQEQWAGEEMRVAMKWQANYMVRLCCRAADRPFEASGANTI